MVSNAHLFEIFRVSALPAVIISPVTPHFPIVAANDAWRWMFYGPDSTHDPAGESVVVSVRDQALREVLEVVVATKSARDHKFAWSGFGPKNLWASSIPLFDANGEVEYILHKFAPTTIASLSKTEIRNEVRGIKTPAKSKEIQLAYAEKESMYENIADAYFSVDKNWVATYVNANTEKIVGMSRDQILNRNIWELFPDLVGGTFYNNYMRAANENKSVRFVAFFEPSATWLEVTIHPTENGFSVFNKDITAQLEANERIRDSEEKNRLIMNGALDAIICTDTNNDIIFWNPQAEAIFGWSADEVMGKRLADYIIPERYRQSHDDGMRRYLVSRNPVAMNQLLELTGLRRNGEEFPIELTMIPISQANDEFFCAFVRDISERKYAEEQIRNSNYELEQFAYVASHDLQEPLRMVTSFLTQLEKRYSHILDERGKQYIFFAVDGARRMRQIILDLLAFSRIGKWSDTPEAVDTNDVIREVILLHSKQVEEAEATFEIPVMPIIVAYRTPIEQVFQNLISNALKYRREGVAPKINITWEENASEWVFAVTDNGIGVAQEHYERIFVIFQRLHQRDEYSGSGMGLAIVKKIVQHLKGRIWVEAGLNGGTTFRFSIPKRINIPDRNGNVNEEIN